MYGDGHACKDIYYHHQNIMYIQDQQIKSHKPNERLTVSRVARVSSYEPCLARSDHQRPRFEMRHSATPLAAAWEAPPERTLCGVKRCPSTVSGLM